VQDAPLLGIVRRVGTRTQLENNEWIVTSDARVPPAEHYADEINARPRLPESAQVCSTGGFRRGMEPTAHQLIPRCACHSDQSCSRSRLARGSGWPF
jgi:hypothetical protein